MAALERSARLTGFVRAGAGRWAAMGATLLTLAACSSFPPPFSSPPPSPVAVYGPHYCYRTLAQVDCHAVPLAGEANRLMGNYEAPADLGG